MRRETITIDIDELREDMRKECEAAFFVGGFGGALVSSFDIDQASVEEIIEMAQRKGIDLRDYEV